MYADLHIHTTASDGASTPTEVVQLAARCGLRGIAITDHDTMEGVDEALAEAERQRIDVISGVELSTECDGQEVHILGYCINPENKAFQEHLTLFQNARLNRARKIIDKLNQIGLRLSLDKVLELAGPGSVGRPHIAKALLADGKINSITEAFDCYIGFGKPAYEPRLKYHPLEMVKLIREVGGVPVLAHPGISGNDLLIKELIEAGLQGIEVYHPQHSNWAESHYLRLCLDHNLVVTGGSDYHGIGVADHGRLGDAVVPYETVGKIRQRAQVIWV